MRRIWGMVAATALAACVGNIGGGEEPAGHGVVGDGLCADTPFVRRLTVAEYVATVEAELGVDIASEALAALPKDLRTDGFTNSAGSLIVTLDHAEGYDVLAELAVSKMSDLSGFIAAHTSCTEMVEACQHELVERVGSRLFRAPLEDDDRALIMPIFAAVEAEGGDFEEAARWVMRAMLQAPRFLYRIEHELGVGARALDGWEMASRLSYFIWGAAPDEELRKAAAADTLRSEAQIEAQVRRMLADPRARETARKYLRDWLHLDRLDNLQRDPTAFPDWDPALAWAMKEETIALFEHLVWEEQAPLSSLFDAQITFVSPELAAHYALDSSGMVDLADVPERGGLLTHGSIATIGGNSASMVGRGLFLLETFLCASIGSPPPGVDTTPPAVEPGASQRSYSEDRVDNPSCGGCHAQFEPIAWGLERYDPTGAYRLEDGFGNELKQDGWVEVRGTDPVPYTTTRELGEILAENVAVTACYAEKSSQFALGRRLGAGDACSVDLAAEHFTEAGATYQDLVVAIALSPMFRNIHSE